MATKKRKVTIKNGNVLPLDCWVGYRFGLIATRIGVIAAKQYMSRHKLTTSLWRALAVVARFEPLSASALSEHSRLDPPKVSRAIDGLVERKLLLRRTDKSDERRAVLTLTARGHVIHDDIAAFVTQFETGLLTTLTSTERKALWSALSKIDKQLLKAQQLASTDD